MGKADDIILPVGLVLGVISVLLVALALTSTGLASTDWNGVSGAIAILVFFIAVFGLVIVGIVRLRR